MELKKVILTGKLAELFGNEHHFAINNPAEAVRALAANFKGFSKFLCDSDQQGIKYKVLVGKTKLKLEELANPSGRDVIRIVPVITGGKNGGIGLILGTALLAFATFGSSLIIEGALVAGLSFGTGIAAVSAIGSIGIALALGGISSMLAPQPKAGTPAERPENTPNYTFNGPVNTTAQGHPVPVGYGELIIGSAVISAGITTDNYEETALA